MKRQRGVALITAVLMVALATILAVEVSYRGALDLRRSSTLFALDQAFEIGLGAEAWAGDYLRVRVKAQGPMPGLADRVKELLPDALDVTVEYPRGEGAAAVDRRESRAKLAPGQLFAAYYEHRHQAPPSRELQQLFAAVHEEATR